MKKYATIKYLKEIEESELDLVNVENVLGRDVYDDNNEHEIIRIPLNKDEGYEGESEQISIESLEKIIDKLKKSGANYIEIIPHNDHCGYVFYGIEMRLSTKEEIKKYETNKDEKFELNKRYQEIQKEMVKIIKQLK